MAPVDPLSVRCPRCLVEAGVPCLSSGAHRLRRQFAQGQRTNYSKRLLGSMPAKPAPKCQCRNHLGRLKQPFSSRQAAVRWAATSKRVRGMRMEFYRCPTSSKWHAKTARLPKEV